MKRFRSVLLIPPIGFTSATKSAGATAPVTDYLARSDGQKYEILTRGTVVFCQVPAETTYQRRRHGYPRRQRARKTHLSSTFALPSTSSPPERPRTHGRSCAKKYAITIRRRACIFCNARFSASLPPCTRKRGRMPVTIWKSVRSAVTTVSIFRSVW
jgi:hypothetical protein